jgi:hypothetical protein
MVGVHDGSEGYGFLFLSVIRTSQSCVIHQDVVWSHHNFVLGLRFDAFLNPVICRYTIRFSADSGPVAIIGVLQDHHDGTQTLCLCYWGYHSRKALSRRKARQCYGNK